MKTKPQYKPPVDFPKEVSLRQQFVTLVANDPRLTKEEKDRIVEYGLKALAAEEVESCA